jgi:hypothetical protein
VGTQLQGLCSVPRATLNRQKSRTGEFIAAPFGPAASDGKSDAIGKKKNVHCDSVAIFREIEITRVHPLSFPSQIKRIQF